MSREKYAYGGVVGKGEGKGYLEDLDLDGRIVLRCILMKWDVRVRTGLICLRTGTSSWLFQFIFELYKVLGIP